METPERALGEVRTGEQVRVVTVEGEWERRRRLMDLGLVPGTRVQVVRKSPLGDPVLYRVRSTLIALRREDALGVRVRPDLGVM